MDPGGYHLGYRADLLLNPLYYPPVGDSHLDLRCDWAPLQYQGVLPCRLGVLPATMHIVCYSWCCLSIDPSGLVQHQEVLSLTTLVSSASLGPRVVHL